MTSSSTPSPADYPTIERAVASWVITHHDDILGWRRHLHRFPELSTEEHATTAFIASTLRAAGLEPVLFPGTGLMVDIGPEPEMGGTIPTIAFRGDIDALPLTEETGLPFSSTHPGVMHACGHDVHTTVILALALALHDLHQHHPLPLRVRCIFQPAEEVMHGGAPDVIAAGALQGVDKIYALHVEPKLRVGHVGVRVGPITSASDVVEITVHSPGGHSARPHLTADPVYALGLLVTQLPGLLTRRVDPRTGTVLVFGSIHSGSAPNAIPTVGTIRGTLRTGSAATWRTLEPLMAELVEQVLAPTGCTHTLTYTRGVPPVVNDDTATAILLTALNAIDPTIAVEAPQSSGGEDFSWYLEQTSGSMARLGCWTGVGEKPDLHRENLVVDERCIPLGVRMFAGVLDVIASGGN